MKPSCIMIHHTAVSYEKNPDQFKATDAFHKKKWNARSSLGHYAGYHYEIAKNGRLTQARRDGEVSVACYQDYMNDGHCLHICLDGNFDRESPSPEQVYALRDLLRLLCERYSIDEDNIRFHREYARKTCPGAKVDPGFIKSLIKPKNGEL